jgi:hypothetical protein
MQKKSVSLFLVLAALLCGNAAAFPCRTDFGLVEVPHLDGFAPGDNIVKKAIQRTKKSIGGADGKVSCVFVRAEEMPENGKGRREYSEMFSLSQTSIEAPISHEDFALIAAASREQLESLRQQNVNGLAFGDFMQGDGYYCNTLEIFAQDGTYAFTVMGGVYLNNHLYSLVSHSSTATGTAQKNALLDKTLDWTKRLVAANAHGGPAASGSAPIFSTVPNINDYSLLGTTLESTSRARVKTSKGSDMIEAKFEHPKSRAETAPAFGGTLAFARTLDGYEFRVEAGLTHYDASLDAALDAFAAAKGNEREAMAANLAERLAAADRAEGKVSGKNTFATGTMEIAKHGAIWRDSWRPAAAGTQGSGAATKTIWVQADGQRAFRLEFSLRDTATPLVPVADLPHLNVAMTKIAMSVSFPDKKQFKKR